MPFITDLLSKVTNLRIKIGDKLNILKREIGQLDSLTTNDKSSLVLAVNEVNRKAVVHDGNLKINATNGLTGSGSFTANQQSNSNIDIKIDDDTLTKINNGNVAHSWGDHKSVNTHQYLGATYVYGGIRKPSDFGSCKLKLEMVNGSVFGNGQIWNDVLWMSSYTGEDVAGSNALVFGKMGDEIGFIRQDFNSETWGTYHKIWHSGNFNPDTKANTTGNYQGLIVGNSTSWNGQSYKPVEFTGTPSWLLTYDISTDSWKPTSNITVSNWLRPEINKVNPAGLKEATYGNWFGIIQDTLDNPTYSYYNKLKILHPNYKGYSTELAQSFYNEGIFYRSTVEGQTSNWTKLWDKNDFNDTRVSNWDSAYNSIGFPLSNLTTTNKTSLVGAVNEVNNIQIGGRNLAAFSKASAYQNRISESEDIPVNKTGKSKNLNPDGDNNFLRFHGLSSLGEYTFSTWIKRINTDSADIISFQVGDVEIAKVPIDGTWKYVKYTFNVTDVTELYNFIQLKSLSKYISYAIFEPKLEKGNKSTDWTPAPEDQVSNWAETDSNSLSFIKGKEIVNNEFNNVYDQISSRANNRLSNLASDLTADEKGTIRDKIGVVLPTVNDGNLTLTTGTGLSGSATFTANQSGNSIFSVGIASTHKLPTVDEWNALPSGDFLPKSYNNTSAIAVSYLSNSIVAGRFKIRLPYSTSSSKMLAFTIRMYGSYTHTDIACSGYLYDYDNQWYIPSAKMIVAHGVYPNIVVDVIFGRDTDGIAYVSIPKRNYVGIAILDVVGGLRAGVYGTGWTITEDDTTPNIATTVNVEGLNRLGQFTNDVGFVTSDTITRLRGTTSGTYTSGDLTLLAGSNVSIAQSGNNFTINAIDTNTTYTAGNGLTLSGTTFSLPVTTSGSGNVVSAITQTTNGISVSKDISAMTTSHAANGITATQITDWNMVTSKDDKWIVSQRDFVDGTLITTNINYNVSEGNEFLLELKGNSYGYGLPFDIKIQGYIYGGTIISCSGYTTNDILTKVTALNNNGVLCFWFPRLGYWQGFFGKISTNNDPNVKVVSITNSVDPVGTKRVEININSLTTKDFIVDNFIAKTHVVNGITSTNISNWDNAYNWGDHGGAGYTKQGLTGGINSVRLLDERSSNPRPSVDLQNGVWFDFKNTSSIGLTGLGEDLYAGVMTLVPYTDSSGNRNAAFRLAQSGERMYFQTSDANDNWMPFKSLVDSGVDNIVGGNKPFGSVNWRMQINASNYATLMDVFVHENSRFTIGSSSNDFESIQFKTTYGSVILDNGGLQVSTPVVAQSFYESSLRRFKTNIKSFTKSGLDIINELEIVTFDRNDSNIKNKIGIIADDSPSEILNEELDAVDLYKTVFVLTKAVQELQEEIKQLKQQVEAE